MISYDSQVQHVAGAVKLPLTGGEQQLLAALGGLITDSRTDIKGGIPILKDIPVLGVLFGTRNLSTSRTELLVLITPHVVRDRASADSVTDELRRKLPLLTSPLPTQVR